MFTKEQLQKQLAALGVPKDRPVTIHCSLRAVGETEGRGEGFLEALASYVGENGGLFLVPTHTHHHVVRPAPYTLDMTSDDVCTGTLSAIAAAHPAGVRTAHPTHSVAIFGDREKALAFAAYDEEVNSMSDPRGCMGQLEREDGYILLVGVGQEKNTYLHVAEEELGVPNRVTKDQIVTSVRYPDGHVRSFPIYHIHAEGIIDVSRNFPNMEPAFRYFGAIRDGYIGNAKTQLCRARTLKETMARILERSRGTELLASPALIDPKYYL